MKKGYLIFAIVGLMLGFSISASAQGCNQRPACGHPRRVVAKTNASGGMQSGYARNFHAVVNTNTGNNVRVNNLSNLEPVRGRGTTPNARDYSGYVTGTFYLDFDWIRHSSGNTSRRIRPGGRKNTVFKGEITGVEPIFE